MEKEKVWYLCDGNRPECKKTHCYKNTNEQACRHTADIRHAINFKEGGRTGRKGQYWEQCNDTEEAGREDTTDYSINELP